VSCNDICGIDLNYKNILIIDFGQLGDVILSLPALRQLRLENPDPRLTVMTGLVAAGVVRLSGVADETIAVDRVALRDGPKLRSIASIMGLVKDVRRRGFDLVIDLHSLSETNILAYLSGAKHRLLANRESRSLDRLSNFRPRPPREDKTKHLTERYFDVLQPLGVKNVKGEFHISPSADAARAVESFFPDKDRKVIGLFPGAGHPIRRWPLDHFAELARQLEADSVSTAVFLGPEEADLRSEVAESFPETTKTIDGLSISQFVAAAARLAAFVSNDTGPMHLAACAGSPVVLLLHERAPLTYLPFAEKLRVLRREPIDDITVDEAYRAVQELLAAGNDKTAGPC
jgi:ADP-heptose:LPS heptosyltransferase